MTKNEFIIRLADELNRKKIDDAADIVEEYEQHFIFKLGDGYSEEEIALKLGDPVMLAAQFEGSFTGAKSGSKKMITVAALFFADLFAGIFFALLAAWGIIMAVFTLICCVASVCLLGGLNIGGIIPPMPYWCGAILGLSFLALAVLTAVGCIYYTAFVRQILRSFIRFQRNAIAASTDGAILPSLAINPQIALKTRRRIRSIALISLSAFAACFVLTMIASMLSAGSLEFWHTWGWFGYTG